MSSALYYDPNSSPVAGIVTRFEPSVDVPPNLPNTISNANLSAVAGVVQSEWKVVNGAVVAMTQGDKDAIAADNAAKLLAGQRAEAVLNLNTHEGIGKLQRSVADVTVNQFNILTNWMIQTNVNIAAATSLANLQTRQSSNPAPSTITLSQVKTAITNNVTGGSND